jgi:hypothetical protein
MKWHNILLLAHWPTARSSTTESLRAAVCGWQREQGGWGAYAGQSRRRQPDLLYHAAHRRRGSHGPESCTERHSAITFATSRSGVLKLESSMWITRLATPRRIPMVPAMVFRQQLFTFNAARIDMRSCVRPSDRWECGGVSKLSI